MHNPQTARHVVTTTIEQVAAVQSDLDSNLQTLQTEHGPGAAREYSSDVYTTRQAEIRAQAIESLPSDIEGVLRGAEVTLEHSADFSREGVLRRATIPTPGKDSDDPMLRETMRLNANMELDRKERAIGAASDADLVDRYAPEAVRDENLALVSLLLDEAARRGDVVGMRVRKIIDGLELPEVDADTEHLEKLEREAKTLKSDLHYLRTGAEDTWRRMNRATATYRETQEAG